MGKKLRRLIHLINGTYRASFTDIRKFRQLDKVEKDRLKDEASGNFTDLKHLHELKAGEFFLLFGRIHSVKKVNTEYYYVQDWEYKKMYRLHSHSLVFKLYGIKW